MLFNSYIFILLFLPLCLCGWYGLNRIRLYAVAQLFLLAMSLWFYGYFNPSYLPIIILSIIFNYSASQLMKKTSNHKMKRAQMIFSVLVNIGCLFYYKYFDFFISNVNALFSKDYTLLNLILPLGISFFTFQQISYVVDAYRGEIENCNFLEYACFVTYFPQLIAGPIVTHDELIPQFMDQSKKVICWNNMAKGCYIFVLGLAKKVLIADRFGQIANFGFGNIPELNLISGILVILAYTFQVYFDFSGYCDMAVGLGKMMNIELPVNFDSPYKALTITEFWNRWHKTLTRFFTKYVYIPLGGNRKGTLRTYINIMIVYLVSGLWHGANWTFIVWGILHGLFSVFTRYKKDYFEKLHPVCSWMILFLFLNLTWTIFRADTLRDVYLLMKQMCYLPFGQAAPEILSVFGSDTVVTLLKIPNYYAEFSMMVLLMVYMAALFVVLGTPNAYERMQKMKFGVLQALITSVLLIVSIFSLSGVSTFLYFNF